MFQTVFLTQHLPRELIVTIAKMLSPKLCSRMICKFCQKFWVGSVFMLGHNTYFKLARTPPTIYWLSPSLPLILSFFLSLSYSLSFLYLSLPAISRHFFPNLLSFSFFLSLSLPFSLHILLFYVISVSVPWRNAFFHLCSYLFYSFHSFFLCFVLFFHFSLSLQKISFHTSHTTFPVKKIPTGMLKLSDFFLVCKFDSVSLQKFPSLAVQQAGSL